MSTGCKYNQVNSHFHCIREGCQFSFLLKHQMTSHARKHMRRVLGKNFDRVPPSQVRAQGRWVPCLLRVHGPASPCFHTLSDSQNPWATSSGTPTSFQGPPSLMDAETDEGMDYTGCSPGAASSESSTMDRSCSSTPVGNESTAAGEWQAQLHQPGPGAPDPALLSPSWERRFSQVVPRRTGWCGRPAGLWDVGH